MSAFSLIVSAEDGSEAQCYTGPVHDENDGCRPRKGIELFPESLNKDKQSCAPISTGLSLNWYRVICDVYFPGDFDSVDEIIAKIKDKAKTGNNGPGTEIGDLFLALKEVLKETGLDKCLEVELKSCKPEMVRVSKKKSTFWDTSSWFDDDTEQLDEKFITKGCPNLEDVAEVLKNGGDATLVLTSFGGLSHAVAADGIYKDKIDVVSDGLPGTMEKLKEYDSGEVSVKFEKTIWSLTHLLTVKIKPGCSSKIDCPKPDYVDLDGSNSNCPNGDTPDRSTTTTTDEPGLTVDEEEQQAFIDRGQGRRTTGLLKDDDIKLISAPEFSYTTLALAMLISILSIFVIRKRL